MATKEQKVLNTVQLVLSTGVLLGILVGFFVKNPFDLFCVVVGLFVYVPISNWFLRKLL
jgi:hypothetical protein